MQTGAASSRCCQAREAGVDLVDRTESCWKGCSGYCAPVLRGEICRPNTAAGRPCTPGSRGGLKKEVLKRVFDKLAEERDGEGYMIDGTIVRAHQDAAGAPKKAANKRLAALAAVHRQSSTR